MFVGPDDMDRHLGGQPGGEIGDSDEEEARDTYMQVGIHDDKHVWLIKVQAYFATE